MNIAFHINFSTVRMILLFLNYMRTDDEDRRRSAEDAVAVSAETDEATGGGDDSRRGEGGGEGTYPSPMSMKTRERNRTEDRRPA